jgi:hypothetical protein
MDVAVLDKLLRRTNATITEERTALAGGRWPTYLRERVPPPSRLAFARHRAWQAAYERALQIGNETAVRPALVFPVWLCSNQDDEPSRDWALAVVAVYDDDSYELYEKATLGGFLVLARIEEARIGFIMPSRFYASEIELPYRNEHYVAVESRRIERIVGIDRIVNAATVSAPTRTVPAFVDDAEPAVALDSVEPTLATRVRSITDKLRSAS